MAELGHAHRVEPDLVAEERHGLWADRLAEPGVDGGERLAHDRQRRVARHAPPVDEPNLEPGTLELGGDLRPGAVDDADLVLLGQRERERRRLSRDRPADLEDDAAHVR